MNRLIQKKQKSNNKLQINYKFKKTKNNIKYPALRAPLYKKGINLKIQKSNNKLQINYKFKKTIIQYNPPPCGHPYTKRELI